MTATLVYLHYSPWSERAAWALDHHRIVHDRETYMPMLGEPLLRLRLRRFDRPVTVPVLFDGHDMWSESWDIARYADRVGRGESLFPDEKAVALWSDAADVFAAAGRARTTARAVATPDALVESVPPPMNALGPLAVGIGKMGARFLEKKYQLDARTQLEHEEVMRRELERLREALDGKTDGTICDAFTYADIAFAASLQFLQPVDQRFIALGPASRKIWTDPLANEFSDVLAWRDAIYARYR